MRAIGYENKTLCPIIKIKYDNFYEFVDEISFLSFIKELSGIKAIKTHPQAMIIIEDKLFQRESTLKQMLQL